MLPFTEPRLSRQSGRFRLTNRNRARMLLDSNHGRTQTTAKSTPLQKDRNTEGQPVPNCGYRQAKFEVDPQLVANTPTSSMDAFVNLSRRGRASKPSLTSTWMTAVVTVVALTTNPVKGADISTDYLKPAVSSKVRFGAIQRPEVLCKSCTDQQERKP